MSIHDRENVRKGQFDLLANMDVGGKTYLVPSNKRADEVLRAAFGEKAVYDGASYRLEPSISRKPVLVPAITEILKSYPQE